MAAHSPPPTQPLVKTAQLGLLLVQARKAAGMSQSALAVRLRLSQSRVSYLELNPQHISVEQLLDWTGTLGLELSLGRRPTAEEVLGEEGW